MHSDHVQGHCGTRHHTRKNHISTEELEAKLGIHDIRVGPRHGANSGGGNEPRFRPAGEVKNIMIVYENRGAFNKYYLL